LRGQRSGEIGSRLSISGKILGDPSIAEDFRRAPSGDVTVMLSSGPNVTSPFCTCSSGPLGCCPSCTSSSISAPKLPPITPPKVPPTSPSAGPRTNGPKIGPPSVSPNASPAPAPMSSPYLRRFVQMSLAISNPGRQDYPNSTKLNYFPPRFAHAIS